MSFDLSLVSACTSDIGPVIALCLYSDVGALGVVSAFMACMVVAQDQLLQMSPVQVLSAWRGEKMTRDPGNQCVFLVVR